MFQYSQTDAKFHGAEVEASYVAWREGDQSVKLEGSYDWVRGSTDLGVPARVPPWALTGRAIWTISRLEVQGEVRRVASQNRVSTFELPTDAYTQVNAMATYKVADTGLRLFIDGRNLTNETIREHVSFLKDFAPSPGRSVRAGFAWRF